MLYVSVSIKDTLLLIFYNPVNLNLCSHYKLIPSVLASRSNNMRMIRGKISALLISYHKGKSIIFIELYLY